MSIFTPDPSHELKAIAERVGGVKARETLKLRVQHDVRSIRLDMGADIAQRGNNQRRVRFRRWPERILDPEVKLQLIINLEPTAAARSKVLWLLDLD
jgi:hypothetical protein